jgi:hypothetical protein
LELLLPRRLHVDLKRTLPPLILKLIIAASSAKVSASPTVSTAEFPIKANRDPMRFRSDELTKTIWQAAAGWIGSANEETP